MRVYRLKSLIALGLLLVFTLAAALWLITVHSRPRQTVALAGPGLGVPVILDAGHGGLDGGAVAKSGVSEAGINLAITLRTQGLLEFFGVPTALTRTGEGSLSFDPDASTRQNKNADLHARLDLANGLPGSPFLSIHLNNFSQPRYSGAQVFYGAGHDRSGTLAGLLQARLRAVLDPENVREAKPAPQGVYLMREITAPAVTIECGFLSNVAEAERLGEAGYQTQIALAIAAGYMDFLAAR